jgi:hypothetical protein
MQFLVLAYDATDEGAAKRRLDARSAHLEVIARYKESGNMKIGAAILNDDGQMVGSCIIADFPDREALDAWLVDEPYILQDVWQDIYVQGCKIAPSFA